MGLFLDWLTEDVEAGRPDPHSMPRRGTCTPPPRSRWSSGVDVSRVHTRLRYGREAADAPGEQHLLWP
ncbi:hypothetical protein [Streptomyces sp. NPDC059994]|uniref:hypothetical protein n=1 Tax=Streptomyces sp. NPDC059994 TaxID=3347029 RepID=UPI00369BA139